MENIKNITEEDKIKSAYALNLCTVSVSQIVDYDDLNVLEQEYDAILNNLNLEKVIKNDSLLNVLKQILDTITYFKMEDIEKKIIEKEYQQQMKNAIWSSVPNFGMIVAGGSPLTMAISLVSQVGIGYMNYRKNKNEYTWDKERKLLKLQQAAMEQLNGLRRELFTTAWNLAETYEFPDELRLTEKQIKQYNDILKDTEPISKYERLNYIKDNFSAYPPFWYFLGSTANYIANCKDFRNNYKFELSEKTRFEFKETAFECFKTYEKLDKYNILREDQITSSWALEYADLLIAEEKPDSKKIKYLIERAEKASPNSYDILEFCTIAYLRINETKAAESLLRFLVNEDYNKVINGQILSSIYVKENNIEGYDILKTRVGAQFLFPMPKEGQTLERTQEEFVLKQKNVLKEKYSRIIDLLVEKYSIKWNKIYSTFDHNVEYDDSFFNNSRKSINERFASAARIFSQDDTKSAYNNRLRNSNIQLCMSEILFDSVKGLFSLPGLNDEAIKDTVIDILKDEIVENREILSKGIEKANENTFDITEYKQLQEFTIEKMYEKVIPSLKNRCSVYVNNIDDKNLSNEEGKLRKICRNEKIEYPEIQIGENKNINLITDANPFTPDLFGAGAVVAYKRTEKINNVTKVIKDFISSIHLKDESLLKIYLKGDSAFDSFFYDPLFNEHGDIKSHAIAVFKDFSKTKFDLIFTTEGIVSIKKGSIKSLTPYNEVGLNKGKLVLYNDNFLTERDEYLNPSIDSSTLYELSKKISDRFERKVSDNLEFIENIDGKIVSEWFKLKTNKFDSDVRMAISYPDRDIMFGFGFNPKIELSKEKNLIQFVYDDKKNRILAFRIIEFKNIDTNLQALLEENKGMLSFKK